MKKTRQTQRRIRNGQTCKILRISGPENQNIERLQLHQTNRALEAAFEEADQSIIF